VQSQDLTSAVLLLSGLGVLMFCGGALVDAMARLIVSQFEGGAWLTIDVDFFWQYWMATALALAKVTLPILLLIMLVAVASNMMQIGFIFLPEKALPDFSRANPMSGFGRLFSMSSTMRLAFGIFKILIVGAVGFMCLWQHREQVMLLADMELPQVASFMWEVCLWTGLKIGLALLILAILDYAYQRWKHEQDLRMTPQEVREEMRNLQGDPQIASRRRAVQRQLAIGRLSSAVPKADVVITNPTELAVAIQYEPETMAAPIVVAKGAGVLAQRIRRLALENGVPIVEKKPLAQALYKDVDVNHPIPDQMYAGVAEVLAYVYQLKGKALPGAK
jgi:flagellar biosynthesis protein FlhB